MHGEELKVALPVGSTVRCTVKLHARFGFFVEIDGHTDANALVLITDFERARRPQTEVADFPPVGTLIDAAVLDHVDPTRQIRLHGPTNGHDG